MRRILTVWTAVMMALAGSAIGAEGAGARTLGAADLAADCNDDGRVLVGEDTRYVGGRGEISGAELVPGEHLCLVDVTGDGIDLAFIGVTLVAKGNVGFNVGQDSHYAKTSVLVFGSEIDMHPAPYDGGPVSIKTGCCGGEAGEQEPRVLVVDSRLRGTGVELGASPSPAPNGRFAIVGSTVEATGDPYASVPDIVMESLGPGGEVRALRTTFVAADGLAARSGPGGLTWMVGNRFLVGGSLGTVLSSSGGRCVSFVNSPPVPCT